MTETKKAPAAKGKPATKKPAAKPAAKKPAPKPAPIEEKPVPPVEKKPEESKSTPVTDSPQSGGDPERTPEPVMGGPVKMGASIFPFAPADLPKMVLWDKSKLPKGLEVDSGKKRVFRIHFEGTILNELNLLNHYTAELRKAFKVASMPKWKVIFLVNGKRYVSTL
jgi:hypothetical protein